MAIKEPAPTSDLGPEFSVIWYYDKDGEMVKVSVRNTPWPDSYRSPELAAVTREYWRLRGFTFRGEIL